MHYRLWIAITFMAVGFWWSNTYAATYDASGAWNYSITGNWVNPGNAGCTADANESGVANLTQTGNSVTLVVNGIPFTGTVNGSVYSVSVSYPESGGTTTVTNTFTLNSPLGGSGNTAWTWSGGNYACNGGGTLTVSKQVSPPIYDASGNWNYTTTNGWADGCAVDPDETGVASLTQQGNQVTVIADGKTYRGYVSGAKYTFSTSYADDGGLSTDIMTFTLSSGDVGTGNLTWTWSDGIEACTGGSSLSVSRVVPPTYDATGTWGFATTDNWAGSGCSANPDAAGVAAVVQTGSSVTLTYDGKTYTGKVEGADYALTAAFADENGTVTESLSMTLNSADTAMGTVGWSRTGGGGACNGGADMALKRLAAPAYDPAGKWKLSSSNSWVDSGCEWDGTFTEVITVSQSNNAVSLVFSGETYTGYVNGTDYHFVTSSLLGGGPISKTVAFSLTSATQATGDYNWTWDAGTGACDGGSELTLQKFSPPDYSASGSWIYQSTNSWVTDAACAWNGNFTREADLVQSGDSVTLSLGASLYNGYVDGAEYTLRASSPFEGGTYAELITFSLVSEGSGSGEYTWGKPLDTGTCYGGSDIELTRKVTGDVNFDGQIDLRDAVIALQIMVQIPVNDPIRLGNDVDGNTAIGLPEALYALRAIAESP